MIPGLPELPDTSLPSLKAVGKPRMSAMPGMQQVRFTDSRAQEAEEYANDMRAAFAYSKAANKRSKAVARAKGRQAQRIAERR